MQNKEHVAENPGITTKTINGFARTGVYMHSWSYMLDALDNVLNIVKPSPCTIAGFCKHSHCKLT